MSQIKTEHLFENKELWLQSKPFAGNIFVIWGAKQKIYAFLVLLNFVSFSFFVSFQFFNLSYIFEYSPQLQDLLLRQKFFCFWIFSFSAPVKTPLSDIISFFWIICLLTFFSVLFFFKEHNRYILLVQYLFKFLKRRPFCRFSCDLNPLLIVVLQIWQKNSHKKHKIFVTYQPSF